MTRNSKKAKKRTINNIPTFMDLLWYHMGHAACHKRYFLWHKWHRNSIHHGSWWNTFLEIKCGTLLLLTSLAPSTHWEFNISKLKLEKKRVLKRSTTRETAFYDTDPFQKKLNAVWLFPVFSLRNQIDVAEFNHF